MAAFDSSRSAKSTLRYSCRYRGVATNQTPAPDADFCSSARESNVPAPLPTTSTVLDKYSMHSPLAVPANFLSFLSGPAASCFSQWQDCRTPAYGTQRIVIVIMCTETPLLGTR